ncbi:MAG: C_GCAxxG_C_C family protein [Coriobacteriales bacterium]|nr:C_GCAxxG_C_C family protein [Coriobacteriales bacterium]
MIHEQLEAEFADLLDKGYHCSQCLALFWHEMLGMSEDAAARMVSALGLGINHGDTCGAIAVSALVLGQALGFSSPLDDSCDGRAESAAKELHRLFSERNGSTLCRELLLGGYDAAKENPQETVPAGIDPWGRCATYCADATEIAEALLKEYEYEAPEPLNDASAEPEPAEEPTPSHELSAASVALGIGALATLTYERRRAENEHLR